MKISHLKYAANKIVVDSDFKLILSIDTDNTLDCHTLDCEYPENNGDFTDEMRDGVLHISLKKSSKSLLSSFNKEWRLAIILSKTLSEFLLNAVHAAVDFRGGEISRIKCNMANGTLLIQSGFRFTAAELDAAKAETTAAVPECFEQLAINIATGKVQLHLPPETYIQCSQKQMMKCEEKIFGQQFANGAAPKKIAVNGAFLTTSIVVN